MDPLLLQICSGCGSTPCQGNYLIDVGHTYKARTGNDNKAVRFHLHSLFIRDTYGVLGRSNRITLPPCVERKIKDTSLFVNTFSACAQL